MNNAIRHDPNGGFTVLPVCSSQPLGERIMMNRVTIARVAHEVNRAYCQALGDHSQPVWEDAPEWQVNSAMLGVALHIKQPDAGPAASHRSWMAQKVSEGWVYGPVKDPENKQHPCIVPFEDLPPEQQAKDYIFCAVVHALVSSLDGTEGIVAVNPDRPLSFGEKAVGLDFNPGNSTAVYKCKAGFAALIDQMNELRGHPDAGRSRHASIAITMLEDSQMRVVKALTWRD